jgi:hypothetical protein
MLLLLFEVAWFDVVLLGVGVCGVVLLTFVFAVKMDCSTDEVSSCFYS